MNVQTLIPTAEQIAKGQELRGAVNELEGARRHGTKAAQRTATATYRRISWELHALCEGNWDLMEAVNRAVAEAA